MWLIAFMLLALIGMRSAWAVDKPIRLVVPFPAGSATDALGRILGQELSTILKLPVVVENRPGAGGIIGADSVKNSPADGSVLLLTTNTTQAANKSLFKQLPYDPIRDFTPVGKVGTSGMVLMVRPDFPAQSLDAFIAQAKASQKGFSYGHGSAASQVSAALFLRRIGARATAIAYKGIPNAVVDLMGGHIDFVFVDLSNALNHIQSGKLKALVVTTERRAARAPSVPTMTETAALSGMVVPGWFAIMAPAATPAPIVARLNEATGTAVNNPEVRERMSAIGIAPDFQSPAVLRDLIASEINRWAGWVSAAQIVPE